MKTRYLLAALLLILTVAGCTAPKASGTEALLDTHHQFSATVLNISDNIRQFNAIMLNITEDMSDAETLAALTDARSAIQLARGNISLAKELAATVTAQISELNATASSTRRAFLTKLGEAYNVYDDCLDIYWNATWNGEYFVNSTVSLLQNETATGVFDYILANKYAEAYDEDIDRGAKCWLQAQQLYAAAVKELH